MPEVIIETTPAPIVIDDPSIGDMRSMVRGTEPEAPARETKPPATETEPAKTETVDAKTETEPGTVETKQEQEEAEPELPEGAKKRIQRIARDTARIQIEIDRVTSERKAKEAELAGLTSGSQPAPTSAKASDARPVRPNVESFPGTLAEYNTAIAEYDTKLEAWLRSETTKQVEQEWAAKVDREASQRAWNAALKDHPELPGMADVVTAASPEPFHKAVSSLDDWAGVTVHLGKNPDELAALVQMFKMNPHRAAAELGKLEERLKPAAKQAEPKASERLPNPPKVVGGSASSSAPPVDLETASMSVFKAEVNRRMKPAVK